MERNRNSAANASGNSTGRAWSKGTPDSDYKAAVLAAIAHALMRLDSIESLAARLGEWRRDGGGPRIYVKEGAILRVWVPFSQGPLVRSNVRPKCFALLTTALT
jgi:hypothetical protein